MMGFTLDSLKKAYDLTSEAIVVSDTTGLIVGINEAAIQKLVIVKEHEYHKTLLDFIPEDERWKLELAKDRNDGEYYELTLQRLNGEQFPALVSGKTVKLDDGIFRVSTILDVTTLKQTQEELLEKTKEQLQSLKSHVIAKVSKNEKEKNDLKAQINEEVKKYGTDVKKLHGKIQNDAQLIYTLKTKVIKLDKLNTKLQDEIKQISKDNFSFEDLLELEIQKANSLGTKFSLVLISMNNFEEIFANLEYKSKLDIVINATIRYFKGILRNYDVIQYIDNEMFYIILANTPNFNISKMVANLTQAKELINGLTIDFTSGMSHFYKNDNAESIIYRCMKNHNERLEEKKK
jgi:PAS domain S-box-containing protein